MNSHSGPGSSDKNPLITDTFSGTPDQPIDRWIPGLLSTIDPLIALAARMMNERRWDCCVE